MSQPMEIKIMLLVGSNGKSSCCAEGQMGWGDLADNIADWHGSKCIDPEATSRHIVTVRVQKPVIAQIEPVSVEVKP
jgi:hypothetical protein